MWSLYYVLLYPLELKDAQYGSCVLSSERSELTATLDVLDWVLKVVWAWRLERSSSTRATFLVTGHDVDDTFVENCVDGLLTSACSRRT